MRGGVKRGQVSISPLAGAEVVRTAGVDAAWIAATPITFDGLAAGRYRVTVDAADDGRRGVADVDVGSGGSTAIVECLRPR